jgi:hypothetical protein
MAKARRQARRSIRKARRVSRRAVRPSRRTGRRVARRVRRAGRKVARKARRTARKSARRVRPAGRKLGRAKRIITRAELKQGLQKLDDLAVADYHEPLTKVASADNPKAVFDRVGRLVGVTLKEPFAEPKELARPSPYTGSYRGWELVPNRFADPDVQSKWQYRTLEALLREEPESGYDAVSVEHLAMRAQHERGFFGYLARSAAKYIFGNTALRAQIDKSIADAKAHGFTTKHLAPDVLVQAGGLTLATILIANIPILAVVGAPVIAGFVVVLYSIGSDAFCQYMLDLAADKEK